MQELKFDKVPKNNKFGCLIIGAVVVVLAILNDFRKSGHFFALMPLIGVVFWCVVGYLIYKRFFKKKADVAPTFTPPSPEVNQSQLTINNLQVINPYSGIFICGGAGSGKSKSIIEPIIYDCGKKGYTGVIYDFKFPELAKHVESAYKNNVNIKRYYINFTDVSTSNLFNPIAPEYMVSSFYAIEFATAIMQNLNIKSNKNADFWSESSTALLASVFWYLREEKPQWCNLPYAISFVMQSNFERLIDLLQTNDECADLIASIVTAKNSGAGNQLAGVVSSLQTPLAKINTPEIYWVMGKGNDFDLNLNSESNPSIVTIGNNPALASSIGPVIGLMLTAITKQLNQQNRLKSVVLVDEFPTVFIPNVENIPATARSNKVATILACQDVTQVVDRYGREKSDTILSNLGNQFYGRTTNPQTAKRVSEIFGKEDREMMSTSHTSANIFTGQNASTSRSYSTHESDVVKAQDVTGLNTGTFYCILSEGAVKMGKQKFVLNQNYTHSDLPVLRTTSRADLMENYKEIKANVRAFFAD